MEPNQNQPATETTVARATLYFQGEFGLKLHKVEARDVRIELKAYAQYRRAVVVTFVPKGA